MNISFEISTEVIDRIASRTAELLADQATLEPNRAARFLDVEGAAAFLSCPKSRIYSLVSARRIPHHRDGSRLLFDTDELRTYVQAGGAKRP